MRIICDIDCIIANLMPVWLAEYNNIWNDDLSIADLRQYNIVNFVKKECGRKVHEIIQRPGFFASLKPLPGAVKGVRSLVEAGHEVVLLTAVPGGKTAASDKMAWVEEYLPFIPRTHVMLGCQKHWVKAGALIDDSPDNITKYRAEWPTADIYSISYPYNASVALICSRFASYQDTELAWNSIVTAILGNVK